MPRQGQGLWGGEYEVRELDEEARFMVDWRRRCLIAAINSGRSKEFGLGEVTTLKKEHVGNMFDYDDLTEDEFDDKLDNENYYGFWIEGTDDTGCHGRWQFRVLDDELVELMAEDALKKNLVNLVEPKYLASLMYNETLRYNLNMFEHIKKVYDAEVRSHAFPYQTAQCVSSILIAMFGEVGIVTELIRIKGAYYFTKYNNNEWTRLFIDDVDEPDNPQLTVFWRKRR